MTNVIKKSIGKSDTLIYGFIEKKNRKPVSLRKHIPTGNILFVCDRGKRKCDKVMQILVSMPANTSSHERGDASRSRSARIYPTGAYFSYVTEENASATK